MEHCSMGQVIYLVTVDTKEGSCKYSSRMGRFFASQAFWKPDHVKFVPLKKEKEKRERKKRKKKEKEKRERKKKKKKKEKEKAKINK